MRLCLDAFARAALEPSLLSPQTGQGAVAQLGERLVRNEEASGSIPLSSTRPGSRCSSAWQAIAATTPRFFLQRTDFF